MSFDPDLAACAQLVERADPDRFLATMAAPVAARRTLFPLHAFTVEVSRAPWVTAEAMIAEMRLQWWRDALAEMAEGQPVRRHEVVSPLAKVLDAEAARALDDSVALRRWDIYRDPFEDTGHFTRYIEATSGIPLWVAARALGPIDDEAVRELGYAAGLARFLQAIPDLEARGRVPLVDGTSKSIAALATEGLDRLARARARRAAISDAAAPALLSAWLAGPVLRQARAEPRRVAAGALGVSEARKRLSLMARAATGRW